MEASIFESYFAQTGLESRLFKGDVWVSKLLLPLKIQGLTYTPVVCLCEDVSLPVNRNPTALSPGNEGLLGELKHNFYFGRIMSSLLLL